MNLVESTNRLVLFSNWIMISPVRDIWHVHHCWFMSPLMTPNIYLISWVQKCRWYQWLLKQHGKTCILTYMYAIYAKIVSKNLRDIKPLMATFPYWNALEHFENNSSY